MFMNRLDCWIGLPQDGTCGAGPTRRKLSDDSNRIAVPIDKLGSAQKTRELPNVSPANPKYQMAIRMWQKLPLPLTRLIGPRIIRNIP